MTRLDDTAFVVVDLETTGLSAQNHRIIELAMVRVEGGRLTDRFESLINPEQYIAPFISQLTGITNTMVFGKPKFEELVAQVQAFLDARPNSVLVGHNLAFDHGFLFASFERAGARLELSSASGPLHMLCTCKLARRLLPQLKSKSLKSVQDHFGIRNRRQHRAMGDTEATAKVLVELLELAESAGIVDVAELLRYQNRKIHGATAISRPKKALRDEVRAFPERPGVYTMRNRRGEVLYVGKAKSLRERVSTYFLSSRTQGTKLARMMRSVSQITYEETGSELSALLLESQKIKELSPRFNSMERRYKSQSFLRLDIQHPFPRLEMVHEPSEDGAEYYGPFRSRESVEALMDVLNRSFKLRECREDLKPALTVRPCFYHEIHRCNAPCALRESEEEYRKEVERLRAFLAAGNDGILAMVEKMMFAEAERLDFEEAQFLKLRLLELQRVLGRGDRQIASLNGSDYVILNKATTGTEILFVRFGRLVKQVVMQDAPENIEEWFYRQLRMYYGIASAIPTICGKAEIDEIRILSHWVEQRRKRGTAVVYVANDWTDSVARLTRELKRFVTVPRLRKPQEPATDVVSPKRLVARKVKTSTIVVKRMKSRS